MHVVTTPIPLPDMRFEQMPLKVLMCNPIFHMQYFVEANAIALRRVSKDDMRHIAKATGATQVQPMFLQCFLNWQICNLITLKLKCNIYVE